MKKIEEEEIASHHMLEEEKLKIEEEKKMNTATATLSKEEANMTDNAPTDDAPEEELRGVNKKNREKGGMKDNVTHSNINNHLI